MRVYITADIEGTCGFTHKEEGDRGTPWYPYFAREMALEAAACARGAISAGAEEVVVHDAHDTARNIDPTLLPEGALLMRRSGPDPYAMVSGLQNGGFDALMLVGFHSWVGSAGNPASHTFNRHTTRLSLNGQPLSEFLFDVYSAASLGVPTPLVSGDKNLCAFARAVVPGIQTVEAVEGLGPGTLSRHPAVVQREIAEKAKRALLGDCRRCMPALPDRFRMEMEFADPAMAAFNRYYPGVEQLDDRTLTYEAAHWLDVLVMVHFVLDK